MFFPPLSLKPNGSLTYTPNTGYTGNDTFNYYDTDGTHTTNTVTDTISVTDSAPVANNDSYGVHPNMAINVAAPGVLANDTDPNGTPLTAILVTGPSHGTLTLNSNGSFTYTPNTGYTGTDSFTYKASDGILNSNTATVTLTIHSSNTAPVANNDSYSVVHDRILSLPVAGVLANDTDAENDPLTAVLVAGPSHGSVTLNSDGSFTYVPTTHYVGSDSFTYQANDGLANSNTATVTISVNNTAPVANNDSYSDVHDRTLSVAAATGVLANDTDANGDPLAAVLASSTTHGSLTLNSDGSFTYTPNTHYTGSDTFTYYASDGVANSSNATVTITLTNNAPVANNDSYTVVHDRTLTVVASSGVLANDTDANNDPLTAVLVSTTTHGSLTLNSDGSFTYTPNTHYTGSDSFTYQANDGVANSNTATVTISVTDNAPVANNDSYGVHPNTAINVAAPGVLANDTDADGDALTANLVSGPSHGTLTLNSNGSFTYAPSTGYTGTDSFTYKASDGVLNSNTATVTLTIHSSNTAPVANNDSYSVVHDQTLTVAAYGILTNDTDANGDPLTAVLVSSTTHGSLTLNSDGSFTYTPNTHYTGTDSFTYQANDGVANRNTATVTISVTDQTPVVTNPGNQSNSHGDTVLLPIVASDADGDSLTFSATGLPSGLAIDTGGVISGIIASTADTGSPYTVTVSASDGVSSGSQTFTWTVSHIVIANPGNQSNGVGDQVWVPIAANDSDGDTLTYSATSLPSGLSISSSSGLISGTIGNTDHTSSPYTVTVTATDTGSHSASQTFTWIVPHVGLANPGNKTNTEGDSVSLQLSATDPDGDTLTYSSSVLPAGLSLNSSSGLISGTIAAGAAGTGMAGTGVYNVLVAASDGTFSSSQYFTWTVNPYVTVTNPGNKNNVEGNTVSLQIQATDAGGKTLTYSAANLPSGLTISSTTGLVSGTVATGASSSSPYATIVSASDGTYTSIQVFTWTVTHTPNQTPNVTNPGNQANNEGETIALQIAASDTDGDPLTYSATGLPDGLSIDASSGLITGTLANTAVSNGPFSVTVTADDGNGATASQTFSWMVTDAALAAQGVAVSATEGTQATDVTVATFTDPNPSSQAGDFTATVTWGDNTSDTGTINPSGGSYSVTDSHTYSRPGSYTVSVTIADTNGSKATTSSTATVAVAPLSVIGVAMYSLPGSQPGWTVATFTDANLNDPASSYSATINWGDGTGSTIGHISGALGAFIVGASHTFPAMSTFTVSVTVTDKDGTSVSTTTTAIIAPILAGATANLSAGLFSLTGGTPTATIAWGDGNSSPGAVGGQSGSWSVSGSHIYIQNGSYTVTVTVTNSNGSQSASNTVVVAIAPITTYGNSLYATPGQQSNLLLTVFTDANPNDSSGAFSAPINWGDGTTGSGTITGTAGLFQMSGTHTYSAVGYECVDVLLNLAGLTVSSVMTRIIGALLPQEPTFALHEMAFQGGYVVYRDDGGDNKIPPQPVPYYAPQWLDGTIKGDGRMSRNYPYVYVRHHTLQVRALFTLLDRSYLGNTIAVKATVTAPGFFTRIPATTANRLAGAEFMVGSATANDPFPNVVNAYDNLKIYWQTSTDGTTWTPAGTSKNLVYLTFDDISAPLLRRDMLQTVVDYGSRKGAGLSKPTDILNAIWSNYSTGKGPANPKRALDGKPLHYWSNWMLAGEPGRTHDLIWSLDGRCGHWAPLLWVNILAQGLPRDPKFPTTKVDTIWAKRAFENLSVDGRVDPLEPEGFLVNYWHFNPPARPNMDPSYPFTNFIGHVPTRASLPPALLGLWHPRSTPWDLFKYLPRFKRIDNNPDISKGIWQGYDWEIKSAQPDVQDLTAQLGLHGQNSPYPLATFWNHCVVKIGSTFYDPSYGVIYLSLVDLQDTAIAGFYKVKDINDPKNNSVRAMLIRTAPKASIQNGNPVNLQITDNVNDIHIVPG